MDYGQLQTALVLSPLVPIYREVSASLWTWTIHSVQIYKPGRER